MIFSAVEQTGKAPFDTVFIHGLVRDAQGRKMSKSLGNGVDPLKVIEEYGADALRLVLVDGVSPGNDTRFSDDKLKAARNFANKLWNANRFILMNLSDEITKPELPDTLTIEDKWVLTKYNQLVKEVTENFDKFELGVAVAKLKDFIWDIVCDWYIELCKKRLQAGGETSLNAQKVLIYVMTNTLKLLHPVMPFITEEIWQSLPNDSESIMTAQWPKYDEALNFAKEAASFEKVMAAIRGIRNARAGLNVAPSRKASLYIATDAASQEIFEQCKPYFESLASASEIQIAESFEVEKATVVVTDAARIFIPMGDLVDYEKELARLNKEKASCEKDIEIITKKLSNEQFVAKAPAALVEKEKEKLENAKERMNRILESIAELG
jgi:valyl-tRNA synthetase